MKNQKLSVSLYCVAAAMIWGISFVVQKTGASVGTFTFTGIRMIVACVALLPVIVFNQYRKNRGVPKNQRNKTDIKTVLRGGMVTGIILTISINLQQHAFTYDIEAGKVAFITALYMILVPVLGLFLRKRPPFNIWIGVFLGTAGLYFICVKKGDLGTGTGEILSLACALGFALHILAIDKYGAKLDALIYAFCQFFVTGVLSVICMFIFEKPHISEITGAGLNILYAGIMGSACAFTFQVMGQQRSEPAIAGLLLCLESVFAVLFGWLILHDNLGTRVLIGCAVMFSGVLMTQIPFDKIKGRKKIKC
ncbi:MAG: DMT family transporter [Clostridiales bacterium]|nr:DMT family transporter [Clostridiales bacterium]